ncbi:MAG: Gfo/Idh/MocA family oxidoreductase [bacterium]
MSPSKNKPFSRRDFLKTSALGGLSAAFGLGATKVFAVPAGPEILDGSVRPAAGGLLTTEVPARQGKSVLDLRFDPMPKVRVAICGLNRGLTHLESCLDIENVQIVAVNDLRQDRVQRAVSLCEKSGHKKPDTYVGPEEYKKIVARDDIDVLYIATPWEWHIPMAIEAMKNGKHAAVEVLAAVSLKQCWELVDASEKYQRYCLQLENCNFGESEMAVMNMIDQGVFGTVVHAECAYVHNLLHLLHDKDGEGAWRRAYHYKYNGNLYPTHGLGPVAWYMNIHRGNKFNHIVSMSSPEAGLSEFRARPEFAAQLNHLGYSTADEQYICGDVNTSLIKTASGQSIMVQHDIITPRPYSRINSVNGTRACYADYPPRLATFDAMHSWEFLRTHDEGYGAGTFKAEFEAKHSHPMWKSMGKKAKTSGGHGGMDYMMNWYLMQNFLKGRPQPFTVYDAAAWSSVLELSAISVAHNSAPVEFPDFTRGAWNKRSKLNLDF